MAQDRLRGIVPSPPTTAPLMTDLATNHQPARPAAGQHGFAVASIRFEGNTVIPLTDLAVLARPFEGRRLTLGQLRVLTGNVQRRYRSRGYFLARAVVPVQQMSDGIVRIAILEGRLGAALIEGNRHYSTRFIERFFAPAFRGGLVQEGPLTRALLILNEFQELRVQSVIQRGTKPGTSDLVLRVTDRGPWHLGTDYNNYGNRLVGRNRAGFSLSGGSVVAEGDDLLLRLVEPFPTQGDPLYQAGYSLPLGDRGARLGYQFTLARTRVGLELAALDIRGDAQIHGITWSRPLIRKLTRTTNLSAGLFVKTIKNFVFGDTPTSRDDLRTLTLGYGGTMNDRKGRTFHNSSVTQGLGTALGGNRNGDPQSSRAGSGNQFTKLNTDWIRLLEMSSRDVILFRAGLQLSTDPLPTAEQFGIGGPDSVRGFILSEFLGDQGYAVSAEYDRTLVQTAKLRLQAAAFIDRGEADLLAPAAGERASRRLVGAGAGVRAQVGRLSTIKLDVGFPINQSRNVQGDDAQLYAPLSAGRAAISPPAPSGVPPRGDARIRRAQLAAPETFFRRVVTRLDAFDALAILPQ